MGVSLRVRKPSKKTGKAVTYYLDIYYKKERWSETLKIDPSLPEKERRNIAEIKKADRTREIFYNDEFRSHKPINFYTFYEKYIEDKRSRDIRRDVLVLKKLRAYAGKTLMTNQINQNFVRKWKEYLVTNHNGHTPKNYFHAFKKVCKEAMKEKYIKGDPFDAITNPSKMKTHTKEIVKAEEIKKLRETIDKENVVHRAFIWCCYTGMTYPEARSLKHHQIREGNLYYTRNKTKKDVEVPLIEWVRDMAGIDPNKKGYVFEWLPSDTTARKHLRKWCEAAGIEKNITWYSARHTFGTLLASEGVSNQIIAKLMGNTSSIVDAYYINHVDEAKKKAMDLLSGLM